MSRPNRFSDGPAWLVVWMVAWLVMVAVAGPAAGQARLLDGPRAAGAVGERFDGYAQIRDGGGDIQQLVDQVNAERRKVYTDIAGKEGTTVEAVGRIYADRIRASAPAGTWFLGEDGLWSQ